MNDDELRDAVREMVDHSARGNHALAEEVLGIVSDEIKTRQGHTLDGNHCRGCGQDPKKPGLGGCSYRHCSLCGS